MLNAATKANLERKAFYVDHVQTRDGVPMFSWVDLSLTELCNRACVFCPRVDPAFYPNQALHMSLGLVDKMARELASLEFAGAVVLCGFGEPLLHPRIADVIRTFGKTRVEIVTNGDKLTVPFIRQLVEAGCDYMVVSAYDGPEQIGKFDQLFAEAGYDRSVYTVRDRWYGADQDYGLKLTNRGGVVTIGDQPAVDTTRKCFYTAYEMTIDWNGDALLCVQDWHKKVKLGTVASDSLWNIWTGPLMTKHRMRLINGRRVGSPCAGCNAEGILHGSNHADAWKARPHAGG